MIINHNLQAMNANRQMGVNQTTNAKSMEKLSSGMRINRAGDDAAGLSISEKMRAQINGLNQASRNAQDGISLIQTAEGALDESHSILQRMRELTVQATTETNDDQDRTAIQDELDALTEEIERISTDTEFNGKTLLDGSEESIELQVGANVNQQIEVSLDNMGKNALLGSADVADVYTVADMTNAWAQGAIITNEKHRELLGELIGTEIPEAGITTDQAALLTALAAKHDAEAAILSNNKATGKFIIGQGKETYTLNGDEAKLLVTDTTFLSDLSTDMQKIAMHLMAQTNFTSGAVTNGWDATGKIDAVLLTIMQAITDGTEVEISTTKGVDVSNTTKSESTLNTLDEAIKKVSTFRSQLGAVQNRLEHTIKNLDNAAENTQAAESRIRDVDMAEEMMEFTKTNVLSQASQSMLAQANQKPNQVLQLLG